MRIKTLLLCAALSTFALVTAAQNPPSSSLPAAPSAVKQPPAPPAPAPAPVEKTSPAQPTPAPASTQAPPEQKPASPPQQAATTTKRSDTADDDPSRQGLTTIRVPVNEVSVIFTVTDKHGHFVKALKQNDFKVLDDNKPPERINSFNSETNLPLRVGLLVDASNSVRDRFKFEQESAIEFLNQIVRPRSDRAFIIGFDTTAEVTQDFTDSTEKLSHGVRMLRPGGGTALFDALYFACRDKLMKADQSGEAIRRAIILLSDGDDNQSRVTREEAIEMAQRAGVIVYTISTNSTGIEQRGDKVLQRIAEATGGRAFTPFKPQEVADAFQEIQEELRSQYALSYKPADFKADGHFREISIVAENHKGLHVRARKGYYAPK